MVFWYDTETSTISILKERINKQIRAAEVRVIDDEGTNLGVFPFADALKMAEDRSVDLIEISPAAKPPICKLQEFGKYQYEQKKKAQKAKSGAKATETKSIQIKVGTGDHDLELKARNASKWLKEGHRIKVELYLRGRSKGMDDAFLRERLDRVLHFVTEHYKIAEPHKRSPKGLAVVIERDKGTKDTVKQGEKTEKPAQIASQ
ncbi:MAG: translation initiation factor IF-3 [Candidatus Pacebacteria bacterium]|jgi:translation initiation factor IF-3|nr:translation initiation factor IF-3 [Candidatus Paceibacterota bacterium]MBP9701153.1 translation initiation factor IF-3 [Candidatus Paceibacterota bacterium]